MWKYVLCLDSTSTEWSGGEFSYNKIASSAMDKMLVLMLGACEMSATEEEVDKRDWEFFVVATHNLFCPQQRRKRVWRSPRLHWADDKGDAARQRSYRLCIHQANAQPSAFCNLNGPSPCQTYWWIDSQLTTACYWPIRSLGWDRIILFDCSAWEL